MFKSAATKLAHNSTIPALARNPDLKLLQEVIATEKLVLQSFQRLSTDFGKSTDAMRAWAGGEGEDLGDTFSACATLLNHWVTSLSSFASHIAHIRECLKAVRTREEALDEMHRRRKSIMSKADSADKRLNKMSPEHKNLRQQTDLLMGLRDQIRTLDVEIMDEEANLGDWKRAKAREWMGVLFGGLLECSEKGAVVATFGRTIIGYVSTEKTQPGLPRAHYSGHAQVEPLVVEAERELHKIAFVSGVGEQPSHEFRIGDIPGLPPSSPSSQVQHTPAIPPQPYASSTLPNNPPSNPHELNDFGEYNPYSQSQTYTPGQRTRLSSLDQPPPATPIKSSVYAPFPPQGGSGFTPGHNSRPSQSSTISGSGFTPGYPPPTTAPAFHPMYRSNSTPGPGPIPDHKPTDDTFSTSIAKALGDSWGPDGNRTQPPPRLSADEPPPSYAINSPSTPTSGSPNPPGPSHIERKPVPSHIPEASYEDDEGVGLSYLNQTNDDGPNHHSDEKRLSDAGNGFNDDRKVRWGSVRDVDAELEKRYAEEPRKSHEISPLVSPGQNPETPSSVYTQESPSPPMPQPYPYVRQPTPVNPSESPTSLNDSRPLPDVSVETEGPSQLDERTLNALAAREIGKQMGVSSTPLSPPSLPFAGRRSVSPRPSFTADVPPNGGGRLGRIPSPPPQFTSSTLTHEFTPSPHPPQPLQSRLPQPPSVGALPPTQRLDSAMSDLTQPDDAYHTPPEYLRNLSTPPSPSMTPQSSLQSPQPAPTFSSQPSTPTTTGKIPAAAFRRPKMRGLSNNISPVDDSPRQDSLSVGFGLGPGRSPSREKGSNENGDEGPDVISPLNLRKKSLPSVPGISMNMADGPRNTGAPRSISSPFPNLRTNEEQPLGPGRVLSSSGSQGPRPRESVFGGEDDFDYLSAYLDGDEKRQSGVYNGATNGRGPVEGGLGTSPPQLTGYGSGRFSTNLGD